MHKRYSLTFILLTLAIVTEKSFCDNTEIVTNKSPNCMIKILENEEQESPILLYLQDERVSYFLVIGENKERTYFYNIPKKRVFIKISSCIVRGFFFKFIGYCSIFPTLLKDKIADFF